MYIHDLCFFCCRRGHLEVFELIRNRRLFPALIANLITLMKLGVEVPTIVLTVFVFVYKTMNNALQVSGVSSKANHTMYVAQVCTYSITQNQYTYVHVQLFFSIPTGSLLTKWPRATGLLKCHIRTFPSMHKQQCGSILMLLYLLLSRSSLVLPPSFTVTSTV